MELTIHEERNINKDSIIKFFDILIGKVAKGSQEVYSLKEAAKYLKISTEHVVYYTKRKGELTYIPIGKKGDMVFRKSDLDEFLAKKARQGIV